MGLNPNNITTYELSSPYKQYTYNVNKYSTYIYIDNI